LDKLMDAVKQQDSVLEKPKQEQSLQDTRSTFRRNVSVGAGWTLKGISITILLLLPIILVAVGLRALPIVSTLTFGNVFGQSWNPADGRFGLTPFIVGSLWVTGVAMLIAAPVSLFSAVYLSEYVKEKHRNILRPLIELLAGIPSVVYGLWGVLVIVPFARSIAEAVHAEQTTGYGILSASIVLALMVTPFMIALMEEVLRTTPRGLANAALSLGATRWEVVRDVLIRHSRSGLIAAAGLGFARALGETLAVLMVVGNVAQMPTGLLDAAYPLPALIANNFGEMMSIPLYDAALMLAAFLLLIMVLLFNIGSRTIIQRMSHHD
jgi:phosphate transport system permease protein